MLAHFDIIAHELESLGMELDDDRKVGKIISCLTHECDIKAATMRETLEEKGFDCCTFQVKLKTYEMEMVETKRFLQNIGIVPKTEEKTIALKAKT